MVRDIEKVLGERLERRQLVGFNYGDFNPQKALHVNGRVSQPQPSSTRSKRRQQRYGARNGR